MSFEKVVQKYFKSLHDYNPKTDNEHTHRTDLQNFLRVVCEIYAKGIAPRQEIKDGQQKLGVPDFSFIDEKKFGLAGLLENKAIGVNIHNLVNDKQVKKYRRRSENVILTNYHEWLLIRDGQVTHKAMLGTVKDIKDKILPDAAAIADLQRLLSAFLSQKPVGIGRKKELAQHLALRCHDLRDFLIVEMERQKKADEQSPLWDMYGAFQKYVDSELKPEEFADAFAQMLGFSLFLAKLNVQPEDTIIDLYNVQKFIPQNFGLIKALAAFLKELDADNYQPIRFRVEEIMGMMNHLNLPEIIKDLSFRKRDDASDEEARLFERDPYIYFYEDFLQEYDAKLRESRGVYYTPPPVVNFIIRGVNHILKKDFGIADGLADAGQVQLLDFATGTGTFILEALQQMFEEPDIANSKPTQKRLVHDHILKNMYGFEYLIAPYTIAHLKLSQFLKDKGFAIDDPLKIYLTNTLEMKTPQGDFPFMQKLKAESEAAFKVKEMPIRVIVGNPPYNVKSKNSGAIDDEVKKAYAPEDEKKMNWDDYVKFIRFAHQKMEKIDRGVIGIITNNSYLNAVTLRQMRNRLMQDFSAIYILNLHGNSLSGELAPDGKQDKNVFDIRVGVSIAFFVKTEQKPKECKLYYAAIRSSNRLDKYKALAEGAASIFKPLDVAAFNKQFAATRWSKRFAEPLSFFLPSSDGFAQQLEKYGDFWGLIEIFTHCNSGIQTKRDAFTIHQTEATLKQVLVDCRTIKAESLRKKYDLPEDGRDWTIEDAMKSVKDEKLRIEDAITITYRPFDKRFTVLNKTSKGFLAYPRYETMRHMLQDNIELSFTRMLSTDEWFHIFCGNAPTDLNSVSINSKEQTYTAPLYLYPSTEDSGDMFAAKEKQENFQSAFRQWLDKKYGKKFTPEQVLGYIYAVLHSPVFRSRYQEFLKIDFPRIPFVETAKQFEKLSALGWDLVEAHIMKTIPDGVKVDYQGSGGDKVEKVDYQPDSKKLFINDNQYFSNVPPEAWDFVIGGYQVLDKYLKSRKGTDRPLSLEELRHIPKIIRILCFTHQQMQKIDTVFDCP